LKEVDLNDVITILREVRDPRQPNARHDLGDVLFVALAATICGAKTCVEMAEFGQDRLEELRQMVDLPHGAPSHDTFSRVFRLLDPEELAKAFEACMAEVRAAMSPPGPSGVVALDAKSLRRGYEKGRAFMPPLMVGVFDSQTRLSIAQTRAPEGAEISAALDLLKGLTLKGCTVTADALHCSAATAKAVRDAKAHYAIGLKANRHQLLAEAEAAFAAAGDTLASFETREARHGRAEVRRASVLAAKHLARTFDFPDLAAIGRIEAERTVDGRTGVAVRYLVLSKIFSPRKLLEVVRAHWSIENQLHWVLDVVFDEDDARSRKNHAPENLAVIRRLALNILRAHPSSDTPGRKMRRASWDIRFFFELFAHMR
jgi:predicted transposase YbfD/YdcC